MGNFLARLLGSFLFIVLLTGESFAETIPATYGTAPANATPDAVVYNWSGGTSSFSLSGEPTLSAITTKAQDSYVLGQGTTCVYNGYSTTSSKANQSIGSCTNAPQTKTATLSLTFKCVAPATGTSPNAGEGSCQKTGYSCPEGQNWTLSGTSCTRNTPTCQVGDTKTLTVPTGKWAVCGKQFAGCLTGTLNIPTTYCDGSCMYTLGNLQSAQSDQGPTVDNPKPVFADMTATGTGETCSQPSTLDPGQPPVIPQDTPPCEPGEGVLTSSSGSVKCVPSGTPGNTPVVTTSSSTTTYPDGSTSTTTTTSTTDPATGRTTTTTTTTNTPGPGGGTQSGDPGTTTTNGDSGGTDSDGDGEGDGDEGKQNDFCEKHPESLVCKNSTFSGSCSEGNSAPTCEGDAALCATAKAAYELRCGALGKKGTEFGQKLIEGQDDMSLPNPNNPTNYNVGSLGYSDGGGSCPPDLVFHVMGRSTTVSMSEVCTIGGWLGNIGVALSLLIGGFIVIGAIRG
jgi:hypothetical protein